MPMIERYGKRKLTYSKWHRELWTVHGRAPELHWIDLDAIEYCCNCKEPLLLIELAQDIGQSRKATTVLRKLAARADLPAYLVFWKEEGETIAGFRVREVWPAYGEDQRMTPLEYEHWLLSFRLMHNCPM